MPIQRKLKSNSLIPMPSMADIAFILLIFFILTSTIDMERSIPVALPESNYSTGDAHKYFHIWIKASGEIYVKGVPHDEEYLYQTAKYRAIDNPDIKGLIGADRGIRFSRINRVMETLRDAGVYNIVLLTKKKNDR